MTGTFLLSSDQIRSHLINALERMYGWKSGPSGPRHTAENSWASALVAMPGVSMRWVVETKKDGHWAVLLVWDCASLLLLPAVVVGLDFGADGRQHLFHVIRMRAVGLKFQVFVQGFSGSRRGFQLAVLVRLAVAHEHGTLDEVSIRPVWISSNGFITGLQCAFSVAGVVLRGAQIEVCDTRIGVHLRCFGKCVRRLLVL